jgi:aminoglycoside phosphotransferase (APT) family kinase protein
MHAGQVTVTPAAVHALVENQFPQWRGLRITPVAAAGTVNAIFRIGDRLAARFPLQQDDPVTVLERLRSEAQAATELVGRTRFPTPVPVAVGLPGEGYPMPWSVQTWVPGVVATDRDPAASIPFARELAEFVSDVRTISTKGESFHGAGRGGVLTDHDAWIRTCLQRSEGLLDVGLLRQMWSVMRELPRGLVADVMNHGDLIPSNVLVSSDGRLAGVIDVGGMAPADPALDLVSGWHLLDDHARELFRECLQCDDLEWRRGQAWAFQQAMGLVWYYCESNPAMSLMGRRTLQRITTKLG